MTEKTGTEKKRFTVVVVEDHELLRDSFCDSINKDEDFVVVGQTPSAALVDDLCIAQRPDLVLMDVCTEGGASGLDALIRLRALYPEMKIIIMSGFDELSYSPRAREYGANAFIFKSKSSGFFLDTARRVMDGEKYFPEDRQIPLPNGEAPFTEREMEILRQLCKYKTREVIADDFGISKRTIDRHVENMLEKSGFSTITDLIIYVVSNGWINPQY
jgi:Response regulator containing a CheY-like receiver domain and an HTH DNA-binding domain